MTNKLSLFILISVLAFGLTAHRPVYADTCQTDQLENIKSQLQDAAQKACDDFKSKARDYNSKASSYINSCNSGLANPSPAMPSQDDLTAATTAGADINDTELYKYNGLPWNSVADPGDDEDCLEKVVNAQRAYNEYQKAYNTMLRRIQATKNPAVTACSCDENGQNPNCLNINKTTEEKADQDGDCPPIQHFQQSLADCPLCNIFSVVLRAGAKIGGIAWTKVSQPLSKVVGIFFLVLLALEALKGVTSMGGLKISSYLKSVLVTGLKIAITILLLSNASYIRDYFINPVISGGLDFGLAISQSSGGSDCTVASGEADTITSDGVIDSTVFNKIMKTVRCFGTAASTTPAVGMGLICNSWPSGWFSTPKIGVFLSGLITLLFGIMIWLAMSFYLIDCTVQLGMLSGIAPLLIACWPFKMTQSYTSKGVKMLMNCFFSFTIMGVILLIGTQIITFAITGGGQYSYNELINALNDGNIDEIKKISALDGMRLLILIACCIFAMKLIAKVGTVADQFSQGAGMSYGAEIGGTALAATTALGKKAVSSAGKVAGKGISALTSGNEQSNDTAQDTIGGLNNQWQDSWEEGSNPRVTPRRQANDVPSDNLDNGAVDQIGGGHAEDAGDKEILAAATMETGAAAGAGAGASSGASEGASGGASAATSGRAATGAQGDAQMQNVNTNAANPNSAPQQSDNPQGIGNNVSQRNGNENSNIQQHNFQHSTDKNGNEITKNYDQNGKLRMESTKGKDGSTNTKTFDENGKLQSERMEDAQGNGHSKTYGKDGKLSSETQWSKDGEVKHTDYASNGQSVTKTFNKNAENPTENSKHSEQSNADNQNKSQQSLDEVTSSNSDTNTSGEDTNSGLEDSHPTDNNGGDNKYPT